MFHLKNPIFKKTVSTIKGSGSNLSHEFIISLVGTVIGIILTVGVTYCSERSEKKEMARKSTMLTIHNIDVSITNMDRLLKEMSRQDSLFTFVREKTKTSSEISTDTLEMFINALYSRSVRPVDTSTKAIFSSNFDVWRYIDDPKVIGRIANAYSILEKCGEEYDRFENEKYNAFLNFYDNIGMDTRNTDKELVNRLLSQNDINRIMDALPNQIFLLHQLVENARNLNNRNKSQLKITQKQLDEIGDLL